MSKPFKLINRGLDDGSAKMITEGLMVSCTGKMSPQDDPARPFTDSFWRLYPNTAAGFSEGIEYIFGDRNDPDGGFDIKGQGVAASCLNPNAFPDDLIGILSGCNVGSHIYFSWDDPRQPNATPVLQSLQEGLGASGLGSQLDELKIMLGRSAPERKIHHLIWTIEIYGEETYMVRFEFKVGSGGAPYE